MLVKLKCPETKAEYDFNKLLNDPDNNLESLRQWIRSCSHRSLEGSIRNPCFPICQCSGSGKTKLVRELPKIVGEKGKVKMTTSLVQLQRLYKRKIIQWERVVVLVPSAILSAI